MSMILNRDGQEGRTSWRTRFAPSPTGYLHLGHAYSALTVWGFAGQSPKNFVLRVDDLDHTRCRREFTEQIYTDLEWLGISWASKPCFQSDRLATYAAALAQLKDLDLVYPCYLSRTELSDILSAPHGHTKPIPSTRNSLSYADQKTRQAAGQIPAWRLDMEKAIQHVGQLTWTRHDGTNYPANPGQFGDVIIARKDLQASYHLSVVLDDNQDNIDLVVRGKDLEDATHLHRLLQTILDLPAPRYYHHDLICDDTGKRLAKRDDARSLIHYRKQGVTLSDLKDMLPNFP